MKKLVCVLLLFVTGFAYSQIPWYADLDAAKARAIETDQLILIDFWASWCGPCKTMDKELWSLPVVAENSKKVVPVKINVDHNRNLANFYRATSIPKVLLITASGEIIWEQVGYGVPDPYVEIFKAIPESVQGINDQLIQAKEYQDKLYHDIAVKFQALGENHEQALSPAFLLQSDQYFKEITKKSEDEKLVALAEMGQLLNDAYRGRHTKVIKKIDKLSLPEDESVNEYRHFLKAYCCKNIGDEEGFAQAKQMVKDQTFLSRLE